MPARRRRPSSELRLVEQVLRFLLTPGHGMARLALVLLIIAALALMWWWDRRPAPQPSTASPPPAPAVSTVRIATWNLRQFSERPAIDLRAVAEIITSANLDLLA